MVLSGRFRSYLKKEKLAEIPTCCHSMSLEVSLVYLFINDRLNLPSAETRIKKKPNSNFTCIANHLTGFSIIRVSTERNFPSEL